MRITLEMVDEVISRTGATYKEAKEALELYEGDVLQAIVYLEEKTAPRRSPGQDTIEKLKALVNEGLVSQIIIQKNGKTILDLPIVAGAISAVIFTVPTVAGIIAAIATGCEIKIIKKDGEEVNFNEMTQTKFEDFKNFINREKSKMNREETSQSASEENIFEEDIFEEEDKYEK
ncbi:MAG: hypothetical protein BGO41_13150 [Clostridiales bacterium 38-18]|nr:MAG: hypothetical protein BGO41_13150 [Clostridiales bacterium 38-18]